MNKLRMCILFKNLTERISLNLMTSSSFVQIKIQLLFDTMSQAGSLASNTFLFIIIRVSISGLQA